MRVRARAGHVRPCRTRAARKEISEDEVLEALLDDGLCDRCDREVAPAAAALTGEVRAGYYHTMASTLSPPRSPMRAGLSFSAFPLLSRELVSRPGAECAVLLLRFALPGGAALGVSQPCTHVKFRLDGLLPRARTFSLVSAAHERGAFAIAVKVRPGGRASPRLAALRPGVDSAHFARTLTKRLAAPLGGADARGARLALVVFGIGVTEVLLTAREALRAGQRVGLLVAARAAADLLFVRELCEAAAEAAAGADADAAAHTVAAAGAGAALPPMRLRFLLSREEPPAALVAELDDICGGPGAAARCGVSVARGRVDAASVAETFGGGAWRGAASLCVGTKAQAREAYALLAAEAGAVRRLLGRPMLCGLCF